MVGLVAKESVGLSFILQIQNDILLYSNHIITVHKLFMLSNDQERLQLRVIIEKRKKESNQKLKVNNSE